MNYFERRKKSEKKKDSEKIASQWNRTTKYFKGLIIEVFAYDVDNRLRNILIDCWKRWWDFHHVESDQSSSYSLETREEWTTAWKGKLWGSGRLADELCWSLPKDQPVGTKYREEHLRIETLNCRRQEDHTQSQATLCDFQSWCHRNALALYPHKCVLITFFHSRHKSINGSALDGLILQRIHCVKDFGGMLELIINMVWWIRPSITH